MPALPIIDSYLPFALGQVMKGTPHRFSGFLCTLVLSAIASLPAIAQSVPPLINYQGKLVDANSLPVNTGDYELRFRIWDASAGGNLMWGPQDFNGQSGPGLGPLVPVIQGWFNVILGPMDINSVPIANAFGGTNRFMEIQVGVNSSQTL